MSKQQQRVTICRKYTSNSAVGTLPTVTVSAGFTRAKGKLLRTPAGGDRSPCIKISITMKELVSIIKIKNKGLTTGEYIAT